MTEEPSLITQAVKIYIASSGRDLGGNMIFSDCPMSSMKMCLSLMRSKEIYPKSMLFCFGVIFRAALFTRDF